MNLEVFEDIWTLGQIEEEFEIPGAEKVHTVRMATLWEDDLTKIKKRAVEVAAVSNESVIESVRVFETLVESILSIDGHAFYNPDNLSEHQALKAQLRELLRKCSPHIINFLYSKYLEISGKAYELIRERIEVAKKSSGPSQQNSSPPNLD